MRSSAAKRFGRRQLRQLSDLKEQIESATTSRFSSSMGLADSFPRLRPRPLDEKRSNSSRLGESTPETRLVQVRILLPQPATRPWSSPWRGAPQNGEASDLLQSLPTPQARKPSRELARLARVRRIFSGCPDGSVGSRTEHRSVPTELHTDACCCCQLSGKLSFNNSTTPPRSRRRLSRNASTNGGARNANCMTLLT